MATLTAEPGMFDKNMNHMRTKVVDPLTVYPPPLLSSNFNFMNALIEMVKLQEEVNCKDQLSRSAQSKLMALMQPPPMSSTDEPLFVADQCTSFSKQVTSSTSGSSPFSRQVTSSSTGGDDDDSVGRQRFCWNGDDDDSVRTSAIWSIQAPPTFTPHCSTSWMHDALEFVPPPPSPRAEPRPTNQKELDGAMQNDRRPWKRKGNGKPKMYNGVVVSRGSKNHGKGQCRPCQNVSTPEGCHSALCNYCHYPHDEEKLAEIAHYDEKAQLKSSLAKAQLRRHVAEDTDLIGNNYEMISKPKIEEYVEDAEQRAPSAPNERCNVGLSSNRLEPWYVLVDAMPWTSDLHEFQRWSL